PTLVQAHRALPGSPEHLPRPPGAGRQRLGLPGTAASSCATRLDAHLARALTSVLHPRSQREPGADGAPGYETRRLKAGSIVSIRIRTDSASGTPSRSKMSSACLNTIRAVSGCRSELNVDSAIPSRILPSSYGSPISRASL